MKVINGVKWYSVPECKKMLKISDKTLRKLTKKLGISRTRQLVMLASQTDPDIVRSQICLSEPQILKLRQTDEYKASRSWAAVKEKNKIINDIAITIGDKTITMLSISNVEKMLEFPIDEIRDMVKHGSIPNTKLAGEVCFFENEIEIYKKTNDYRGRLKKITAEKNRKAHIANQKNMITANIPEINYMSPEYQIKKFEVILTEINTNLKIIMAELGINT